MTRPIVWAACTFAGIALAASLAGNRLARVSSVATPERATAASRPATTERTLTVLSDRRGHFELETSIEGQWVTMLVDTGASSVALTSADARKIGLQPSPREFNRPMSTANGIAYAAAARIRELRVGGIVIRDVEAVVMPPGALNSSLLGMSFLRRLQGFDMAGGRLTLRG